jgi:hypothetical protein
MTPTARLQDERSSLELAAEDNRRAKKSNKRIIVHRYGWLDVITVSRSRCSTT